MTRFAVVVALAIIGAACGESSTSTPPPVAVASVTIDAPSGQLEVGQQRQFEASTRDASGAALTGRTVQWNSTAPTVASVFASGTGASATVTAIAPGVATITASSEGKSVSATITVVAVPVFDISIVEAQWTQAAQHPDGSIPMVLDGNAAVLNVITSTTVPNRTAGQVVLTLTDAAGAVVHTDTVAPSPLFGATTYAAPTAQFLVPASQLRAGLRWRVRRDPHKLFVDADSTNDVFPRGGSLPLATVSLPAMRVRFVPITLSAHGNATGNVLATNLETYLPTLRRTFPLGRLVPLVGTPLVSGASFGAPPSGGGSADFWLQILQELTLARVAEATSADETWMGVVAPPSAFNFAVYGGFATFPSPSATSTRIAAVVQTGWFNNPGQSADLVAHELAHTFGRRHSPCGGAANSDPSFPLLNGTIGTPGHDVYAWATGLTTFAASRTAATGDLMGYCFPQWASPYTYSGILQARLASGPVAVNASTASDVARQHVVVVRGQVLNDRITLLPTVTLDGVATRRSRGDYRVELLGDDGRVLAAQLVDAIAVDHSDAKIFHAAVPLDESTAAGVASVRVSGSASTTIRGRASATSSAMRNRDHAQVRILSSGRREVFCTEAGTEAIIVQDRATGALLASSSGAHVSLDPSVTGAVDIACSDGVRSGRTRLYF